MMSGQKNTMIGLVAHVDAGKTTLSEAILYEAGAIRHLGRVDHKDAFLDTEQMEKKRGITIFSKQARLEYKGKKLFLMDTPGHVDFSPEMERTLPLLDLALLVINGANGVQAHTKTLWQLLRQYQVPVILFINKMDQEQADEKALLLELKEQLSEYCETFESYDGSTKTDLENAALAEEEAMEEYLESGTLGKDTIYRLVKSRRLFPCYFGSALHQKGVKELLDSVTSFWKDPNYPDEFGAKVYKIGRDEKGERLSYLKITGGRLAARMELCYAGQGGQTVTEKVNQIRLYSGRQYEAVPAVEAGEICAVTGLHASYAGLGLGMEKQAENAHLVPVMRYEVKAENEPDPVKAFARLKELAEEEPTLTLTYVPEKKQILMAVMGQIQCEIIKQLAEERFGLELTFGTGNILYKETIADAVEGVGHYEPLKHYAEVHLLLEPGAPGSGITVDTVAKEDQLAKNWQRLILSHVLEREHAGVLLGAGLTDVKITLLTGRAHKKHTEGGDFRQATYRAIRQGLMQAESVLLEPVYAYTLKVPQDKVGRAMMDIEAANGRFDPPENRGDYAVLTGVVPVYGMQDYQQSVMEYTKGEGQFLCRVKGYEPCKRQQEVCLESDYDPQADLKNPVDSIFCSHGAGYVVPWDKVPEHMHVESPLEEEGEEWQMPEQRPRTVSDFIDEDELEAIFKRTFLANQRDGKREAKKQKGSLMRSPQKSSRPHKLPIFKDRYLLVDGYNIIFAWDSLNRLAGKDNLDGARIRLQDMLCNYQAYKHVKLIVVFDAYKIKGNAGSIENYHNIQVVFTKEAQTADAYIEQFTHEHGKTYDITVATSDALEQMIVLGQGAKRLSAREFLLEMNAMEQELKERYLNREWE